MGGEGRRKEGGEEGKKGRRGEEREKRKKKVTRGEGKGFDGGQVRREERREEGILPNVSLLKDSVPYLCHVLCHKVDGVGVQSHSNEAHQVWVPQGAVRR